MGSEQSSSRNSSSRETPQMAIHRALERQRIIQEATQRQVEQALQQEVLQQEAMLREAERAMNMNRINEREKARVAEIQRIHREVAQREAEQLREMQRIQAESVQREKERLISAQKEIDKALEDQKKLFEQRLRSQLSTAQTSQVHATNASSSLERNRTPYNYTQQNLQNVVASSNRNVLYPNLNNNRPSTSRNTTTSSEAKTTVPNVTRNTTHDFVFVNKNGETQRFAPSAPLRDRSTSRSRDQNNENDNLNCKTCNNKYGVNIYQCPNGHSSCKDCKMKSMACGICGKFITNMRNIMLEDFVSQQKVKCTNATDGCSLFVKLENLDAHLKECPYKETACPVNGMIGSNCQWRGKISQMVMHFDNAHPAQRQANVDTEMYLPNICNNEHIMYLVLIGNFNFLFHLKVSENERMVYMTVQLLGTGISASKWNYEVHVYNKKQPRRKYEFNDTCSSATVPVQDIFHESNCATIPLSYAMTFINEGLLTYKFYIKKENDYKRGCNKNYRGRGGATRKN